MADNDSSWEITDWFNLVMGILWLCLIIGLGVTGAYQKTALAIVVFSCLWLVFIIVTDVVLVMRDPPADTWSEQLRHWGVKYTTAPPWIFGVCGGRWFHPFDGPLITPEWVGPTVLAALTVAVIGFGGLAYAKDGMKWMPPWAVCLLGLVAGAVFAPASFPAP